MSVKENIGFEEINYFDYEFISEFKSCEAALAAFSVAKHIHNDGTTISVVMHT